MNGIYFDKPIFDEYMKLAGEQVQEEDYEAAWEYTLQAERHLLAADREHKELWAYVLDHKRYLSYMTEQFALNEAICLEIVRRFSFRDVMPAFTGASPIPNTLRAACNLLAWRLSERECTREALAMAINYLNTAFEPYGYTDEEYLLQFYETKAKVYLWASRIDGHYLDKLEEGLKIIKKKDLVAKGLVTDKAILELLATMNEADHN